MTKEQGSLPMAMSLRICRVSCHLVGGGGEGNKTLCGQEKKKDKKNGKDKQRKKSVERKRGKGKQKEKKNSENEKRYQTDIKEK